MSPMFNACMNPGNTGPPPHLAGSVQPNEPPGFYNPPFNDQPTQPHPQMNYNQIRNIGPRPLPNCPPIYEFRVYELTKRLTERPENADNLWWDSFASEFFDDQSTFSIQFSLEDGPKHHTIGRALIPRFFRTMFEDGVIDFSIRFKRPFTKEHPNRIGGTLECDNTTLITQHRSTNNFNKMMHYPPNMDPTMMKENKEIGLIVTTEGRLVLEFVQEDSIKIKTWNFTTSNFQELIPKNYVAMHVPHDTNLQAAHNANFLELTKNTTKHGLTQAVIRYLSLCVILEPMQLVMSRHKDMEGSSPRDCLKNVLYTKWQTNICLPQEQQRPPNKRRKRKSSTPNATGGGSKKKNSAAQMSPGTPNFPLTATQDVMVVGEPSLMGGEFGDEDERVITRLENNQYESSAVPTNGLDENVDQSFGSNLGPMNSNQPQQSTNQSQPNQIPLNQPPSNQQVNNQWSHNQVQPGVNGSVNNSNNGNSNSNNGQQNIQNNGGVSNPPSIGTIEDKKPTE